MLELSVVIPARSRTRMLKSCLESLCHQTQSASDFEVIVVLAGAGENSGDAANDLSVPYKLRLLSMDESNPGAACNHAVDTAAGQYCLFLSADVVAHEDLVAEHLRSQRKGQGMIGIGQVIVTVPCDADGFVRHVQEARRGRYAQLNQGTVPSPTDCCSENLSLPREAILKTGGFAPDLPGSESMELAYRLEREGLPVVYVRDAVVTQECRECFRETAARIQAAGAASVELYRRHPPLLSKMPLGTFHDMSGHALLLRRCLLVTNAPMLLLALIGHLLRARPSWLMDWHRFLHGYFYWRGVRQAVPNRDIWSRLASGTTILMYHACGLPEERASRYVIPGRRFARQMAWLKWRGYYVLSLEEFLHYHREHRLPPTQSVVITFDDGYADNRAVAYPILRHYGFPATIFVVSGLVGTSNQWDSEGLLVNRPLLDWPDLKEMIPHGISIGSHTKTHVALAEASTTRIEEEVAGSRLQLERELGLPILTFAYPYGRDDPRSHVMVERAGFLGGCSSYVGVNDPATPPLLLRRLSIRGTYSLSHFALALLLGRTRILPRRGSGIRMPQR
jgi:peptidoglycan/xylan/chitin deacetylase (PgdA/CDA1 family)/glycosyltransferase involved in cell wall biosynthesis